MTAADFAKKVYDAIRDMRDSDGEPDFILSIKSSPISDGHVSALLKVETNADDIHPEAHTFTIFIVKEK